jgi:hypothetical protein
MYFGIGYKQSMQRKDEKVKGSKGRNEGKDQFACM